MEIPNKKLKEKSNEKLNKTLKEPKFIRKNKERKKTKNSK